jgi:hypothetical protein
MGVPRMTVLSWMVVAALVALVMSAIPAALEAMAFLLDVRFSQEGDTVRVIAQQLGALPGTCNIAVSTNLYIG